MHHYEFLDVACALSIGTKSTTLDNHYALCFKIHVFFFAARYENSGNISFMRVFARIPGRGRCATVGWSKTAFFTAFGRHILETFRNKADIII